MPQTRLSLVALLLVAVTVPAVAQTPAPVTAEPSKACMTSRKKVDKEQRSLTSAVDSIAKDTKGRESCSSKSMCARYDAAISDMEKRKSRHETRLARFKEDAEKDCKAP